MSKVAIQGNASGTGTFTIQSPATNTDRVLSLPDEAGTVLTSGTPLSSFPTGFANGITLLDQYQLTTAQGIGTTFAQVTGGWGRTNRSYFSRIGNAISESSGTFTFPETGLYLVSLAIRIYFDNGANQYGYAALRVTANNSSYLNYTTPIVSGYTTGAYGSSSTMAVINVDDTANIKVQIGAQTSASNANLIGDAGDPLTLITFIKIGEAV